MIGNSDIEISMKPTDTCFKHVSVLFCAFVFNGAKYVLLFYQLDFNDYENEWFKAY